MHILTDKTSALYMKLLQESYHMQNKSRSSSLGYIRMDIPRGAIVVQRLQTAAYAVFYNVETKHFSGETRDFVQLSVAPVAMKLKEYKDTFYDNQLVVSIGDGIGN